MCVCVCICVLGGEGGGGRGGGVKGEARMWKVSVTVQHTIGVVACASR